MFFIDEDYMGKQKVFGIGFHKTGTTSLAVALDILGYSVTGPNSVKDPDIEKKLLTITKELAVKYDAFQDNPWPLVYKEMDAEFPGSKFILTIRNEDEWIKSVCLHFGRKSTPMRKLIYGYGSPVGNEQVYLNRYRQHNKDVIEYFSSRKNDLLVINISKGQGWVELCDFLGHEKPNVKFPRANSYNQRKIKILMIKLKRAKKQIARTTKQLFNNI